MSFNPLKRMLFTTRPPRPAAAEQPSGQVEASIDDDAHAFEDPSVEEVEALLAEGLGSANANPAEDDTTFLDLVNEIVGPSETGASDAPKYKAEDEDCMCMDLPESACDPQHEPTLLAHVDTRQTKKFGHSIQAVRESSGVPQASGRRPSFAVSGKIMKPKDKCSHLRAGAERLVSLMRSGKMSASSIRSAISRSSQRRTEVLERAKRVNDSFLSFDSAGGAHLSTNGTIKNIAVVNQPEVMHKSPMTRAQRLNRLEQNVIAAKQEWESKYRVLMMVENDGRTATNPESLDSRHIQHKEAVNAAAQKVLEASGDLLLAQVELGMSKLPGNQIYYYHDDRARLQGPYKATQLCKLAKLNVMPTNCIVLIDLAQVKGVSVRAAAQTLLRLLDDPDNIYQAAANPMQSAIANTGHTTSTHVPPLPNVSAAIVSGPRSGDVGCGSGSPTGPMTSATGHRKSSSQKHFAERSECRSQTQELRPETDRWEDSGARPCNAKATFRERADGRKSARLRFQEEKTFEVYSFEDSDGDICGPFSYNELQEKFSRGTISETLLLMYDTDFGTTVLSVAQLFRNMNQRCEDLLNADNPPPPSIETLSSSGHLLRRTETSKSTVSVDTNLSGQGTTEARTASSTTAADLPAHFALTDKLFLRTSRSTDDRVFYAACPASSEHLLHLVQSAPTAEAGSPDAVEIMSTTAPSRHSTAYSAAPPDGYGIALDVSGDVHLSRLVAGTSLEGLGAANDTRSQAAGVSTHAPGTCITGEESGSQPSNLIELPSGFPTFEALLHHVAENQMEPIKQRMLRIQGSQRPALMARLDFKALRALAEAPVHVADNAIRSFIGRNYEPQDASVEFLQCLTEQDTHAL